MLRGERYQTHVSTLAESIRVLDEHGRTQILKRDGTMDAVYGFAVFMGSIGTLAAFGLPAILLIGNVDTLPALLVGSLVLYGVAAMVALIKVLLYPTPQLGRRHDGSKHVLNT